MQLQKLFNFLASKIIDKNKYNKTHRIVSCYEI